MQERLQKILSARGIASRRKAEEYITAGLVKVNGIVATLGQKADPEVDVIDVDGQVMSERAEMLYYVVNKPVGIETTNATIAGQKTVKDLLPTNLQGKIFPVGRLDKDSSGLLLLTNDGVLAFRLTHPKFDHEKEYEVTVANPMTPGMLKKLEEGITIDGSKTKPAVIDKISAKVFHITLTEGRYRQIRRMCQKVGSPVDALTRVRIMTLEDPYLKPGQLRTLRPAEKEALLKSVGLEQK